VESERGRRGPGVLYKIRSKVPIKPLLVGIDFTWVTNRDFYFRRRIPVSLKSILNLRV